MYVRSVEQFVLFSAHKMDGQGRLKVDEFFKAKDVPDVYAIGDCNDVPEIKLAYGTETQGKYVAKQFKLKQKGKAMTPNKVNSMLSPKIFFQFQVRSKAFSTKERAGALSSGVKP